MSASTDYKHWNTCLLDYCVQECDRSGSDFELIVQQMLDDHDDFDNAFVSSVREMYRTLLSKSPDPLFNLASRFDEEGRPLCGAFLGLSVIAAEEMEGSEYYTHLAYLLDQPRTNGTLSGFKHDSFEQCWLALKAWVERSGKPFRLPSANKKYIRWPMSHALLRRMDVKKLFLGFKVDRLSPYQNYSHRQIQDFLDRWQLQFTPHGKDAYSDAIRKEGVIRQVVRTLSLWDESTTDVDDVRKALVKSSQAWLEVKFRDHVPELSFMAVQKPGFPATLKGDLTLFDSRDGLYESAPIDGYSKRLLSKGFRSGTSKQVRFKGSNAFVLRRSEYGGFSSEGKQGIPLDHICVILVHNSKLSALLWFLKANQCQHFNRINLAFGNEWVLVTGVIVRSISVPSCPVTGLFVSHEPYGFSFIGGMRTGRRYTWLDCCTPTGVEIDSDSVPVSCFVNGKDLPVVDGFISLQNVFNGPGVYSFVFGSVTVRTYVVTARAANCEPHLPYSLPEPITFNQSERRSVSQFPIGDWIAIGAKPGQISKDPNVCNFEIQWLLGSDADGVNGVVSMPSPGVRPDSVMTFSNGQVRLWAQVILKHERARLGVLQVDNNEGDIRNNWSLFINRAREIDRFRQHILKQLVESNNG